METGGAALSGCDMKLYSWCNGRLSTIILADDDRFLRPDLLKAGFGLQSRMESETFKASRWTWGNHLFPTVIEVTDRAVIRHKRSWFSKDEISISITKVASVHIKTGMIWSDILIESSGGTDPLASHGHSKADAKRIRALVEDAQGILAEPQRIKLP